MYSQFQALYFSFKSRAWTADRFFAPCFNSRVSYSLQAQSFQKCLYILLFSLSALCRCSKARAMIWLSVYFLWAPGSIQLPHGINMRLMHFLLKDLRFWVCLFGVGVFFLFAYHIAQIYIQVAFSCYIKTPQLIAHLF